MKYISSSYPPKLKPKFHPGVIERFVLSGATDSNPKEIDILSDAITAILERKYIIIDEEDRRFAINRFEENIKKPQEERVAIYRGSALYFVHWMEVKGIFIPILEFIDADIPYCRSAKMRTPTRAIRHVLDHDPSLRDMLSRYAELSYYRSMRLRKKNDHITDFYEAENFLYNLDRHFNRNLVPYGEDIYLDVTPSPFALDEIFGASHGT